MLEDGSLLPDLRENLKSRLSYRRCHSATSPAHLLSGIVILQICYVLAFLIHDVLSFLLYVCSSVLAHFVYRNNIDKTCVTETECKEGCGLDSGGPLYGPV
jgi:hypothetical protein